MQVPRILASPVFVRVLRGAFVHSVLSRGMMMYDHVALMIILAVELDMRRDFNDGDCMLNWNPARTKASGAHRRHLPETHD